jgi:hypothetical protein
VTRRQRRVGRVSCSPDLKRERERPSVQLCSCFLHACQKANRQKTGPGRHTLFNTLFSAVTHTVTVRLPRLLAGHTTTVDHCVTQTTTAWSRRDVRNDVPDTAQWQSQWPRVALTSCFRCSNVRLRVATFLWLPITTLTTIPPLSCSRARTPSSTARRTATTAPLTLSLTPRHPPCSSHSSCRGDVRPHKVHLNGTRHLHAPVIQFLSLAHSHDRTCHPQCPLPSRDLTW